MSSPVRTLRVAIDGPSGVLEAAVEDTAEPSRFLAVICHPHPLQQGTMDNKVVTTLARAVARSGGTSVRFNFRGVGASDGAYDGQDGELMDALRVVRWTRVAYDAGLPLLLGGFSFGGAIAYRAASESDASALVTVAPAYARIPESAAPPRCEWLLVQGMADDVISADEVLGWAHRHTRTPQIDLMDDAGHFFHGKLPELAATVGRFVAVAGL